MTDDDVDADVPVVQGARNDPVKVSVGPITRAHAKWLNESFQVLVCVIQEQNGTYKHIEGVESMTKELYTPVQVEKERERIKLIDL